MSISSVPSESSSSKGLRPVNRIVLIGNFPPRRCGIATFTSDVYDALTTAYPNAQVDVVAMVDPGGHYVFPPQVTATLEQVDHAAYRDMAEQINALAPDVVCVQHEFGIFGGHAGDFLLDLLDEVEAPVVTTLHTVLTDPNDDQLRVMRGLIARSSRLIVMAHKGVDILKNVYKVASDKVALVPHGAPDFPLTDTDDFKPRFGLEGREVLFTFGLLSPNKGLEVMIRAMPEIVAARPSALYMVLGSTHPHLVAREGEVYREGLMRLAEDLGVADHVRFVDSYADTNDLLAFLGAADVYVTPYLNEAQITSGTLSYAVAMGKPVVSTPYWHAQELLAEGRGVLTPFGDSDALAKACISLLSDDALRSETRKRAYEAGRDTLWSRLAERYMDAFRRAEAPEPSLDGRVVNLRPPPRRDLPQPVLQGVERMTDGCGMLQHAVFGVPDRHHGYCLDDNARALTLVNAVAALGSKQDNLSDLASIYAAFVNFAWNDKDGCFRNFMSYDRAWLELVGSDDSFARGFQSVACTAETGLRPDLRVWAQRLAERILPHAIQLQPLRSKAFTILGLCSLIRAHPGHEDARRHAEALADDLERELSLHFSEDWQWFEDVLAYDNARIPEALLVAGRVLARPRLIEAGLVSLEWLCKVQSNSEGAFRPVGTDSFGRRRELPKPFDQQPLEAAATIDACAAAFAVAPLERWLIEARRAYDWYLGVNDLGLRMVQPEAGLCYDGLTPYSVNLNQGAESVLSFQWATCAMHRLAQAAGTAGERTFAK